MSDILLPRRDRPLLAAGERLTAAHLRGEQEHRRQRLRRHLRLLHGSGVVCGLAVVPAGDADHPWAVIVCPGFAIGPHGDEIVLPRAVTLDLLESLWKAPIAEPDRAYVAVRYTAAERLPASVTPDACGCSCREPTEQATRVRDCFAVTVLWQRPPAPPALPDLCRPVGHACRCEDDAHVVLACIDLPQQEAIPITAERIHFTDCARLGGGS